MTTKDCGNHGGGGGGGTASRICGVIIGFIIIVLITIFLVWIILQPTKPRFILQDATVYAFNLSQPNLLTSNFQITIASRNRNSRIGIYYDRLHVYATYRNQQITLRTAIPPTYQGHKEDNVWSPFVYGNSVPIAPFNAVALGDEQNRGFVTLIIRADGRVRWKVGTLITGKYHLHVRCQAFINLADKAAGVHVGENAVKYMLINKCSVNV
ncbi:NDR1/HIN1-like protein 12 [Arabidopsis thaliana]|jgi:hypothetical protein|uniref:NDR1/HIN1-like protein 12 n=4 Tax=Arabidopsis TaxID=3701 RepID=NHL12_ARATH|nr:NDR1/HIN1-like 12 [Arabidopsis thaliana]Q9SJ54.1 RecName: Full=NDR1/HIN1-like protein 12 [Arabidopsis thaliana]KAG7638646.1 Late embryogenesis abundant protein LEA_2 subgroup [Arabidopsis thaliana x Arabidopsis arenosa]KAG7643258.1 Late embryogenesis abundant protein LEA_2 subgroup [Arabidopsis suecica]AAD21461.1 putative harpin-induced protein [Arabidopsis thaliana]AAM63109.1 putative harpin-induced protein [Arabidopsis thaliana]ABF83671.1 At2g35960 [Arabidopsis thaliana]|eukprot:NP_181140.1 NDR1/HIN1-like 12 [Arabidopsis thaliana]